LIWSTWLLSAARSTQYSRAHLRISKPPTLVKQQFANALSDHITHLNAFNAFRKTHDEETVDLDEWCENNFLNRLGLEDAWKIRTDLHNYMKEARFVPANSRSQGDDTVIRKALARGMFTQVAIQRDQDDYRTVHGNQSGLIWPGSAISGGNHEWIVYQSFLVTSRPYFQMVTAIMPEWLMVGSSRRLTPHCMLTINICRIYRTFKTRCCH
jgi:oligonucleotide/oligosaccharide-binding OB-fold protein